METITVPVIDVKEPSIGDLRSMAGRVETKEETPEIKTEPVKETVKEETKTSEPGTDTTQQQEDTDYELPPNVAKKIAHEAKKQAFFQSKIDQATSARKAKEAEAEKLTGKPGSEPAPNTEPAKSERPKRPELATFDGNLAEYNAAVAKADEALEKWLEDRTRETVGKELTERQAKEAQEKEWEAATKTHGADFTPLVNAMAAKTPVAMQAAISHLEDWAGVAFHLANHPDEHAALVAEFAAQPYRVIAKLGKLEDRLKPEAKPAPEVPLPRPLKPVAGDAPGNTKRVDFETASVSEFQAEARRMLKRSA